MPSSVINILNWSLRFFSDRFRDFLLVSSFSSSSSKLSDIDIDGVLLPGVALTAIFLTFVPYMYFTYFTLIYYIDYLQRVFKFSSQCLGLPRMKNLKIGKIENFPHLILFFRTSLSLSQTLIWSRLLQASCEIILLTLLLCTALSELHLKV